MSAQQQPPPEPDGETATQVDEAAAAALAGLEDRWRRAVADLDNLRKRYARELERERAAERARVAAQFLPVPGSLQQQVLYFAVGLAMLTLSDAVYLGARFGAGPRDGLMTGAVRVSGRPVWMVRTGIEVVVLTIGWILGGTAGFGTLLIALAMGPLVQWFLRFTTVRLDGD